MENDLHVIGRKNRILLTIGMPVYNEEKYIAESIENLLAQTYHDFVLIISDNASTDGTPEICRRYAEKDDRILYVRQHKNNGSVTNWRYLLDRANTPFFMWACGHDQWHPELVSKLLSVITNDARLACVYPLTGIILPNGKVNSVESREQDYTTTQMNDPVERYLYVLKNRKRMHIIFGIWRREILKKCYFTHSISFDRIILYSAALMGTFKQIEIQLFFMRAREPETATHMYMREFAMITGIEDSAKTSNLYNVLYAWKLRGLCIIETLKMLRRAEIDIGWFSRLSLYLKTIFFVLRNYVSPFTLVVMVLKKLFPEKIYRIFKDAYHKRRLFSQYTRRGF